MKQRFGIAQCPIGDPPIIVDEPTAGLDPCERKLLTTCLPEMANSDAILSTHIVQDVQEPLAHGHHRPGAGALLKRSAAEALHAIRGRLGEGHRQAGAGGRGGAAPVISHKLVAGRPIVHVLSDSAPAMASRPRNRTWRTSSSAR